MDRKEIQKRYREKNKEKLRLKSLEYYHRTKEDRKDRLKQINKEQRLKHRDRVDKYSKEYREKNRDILNEKKRLKRRNEIKSDFDKFCDKVRSSIRKSFRNRLFEKKSRTSEILGCSLEEFKLYIESKFEPWMTWDNRGLYNGDFNYGWDIDHIIPLSSAETEEDVIRLNHYTNLQPLCSKINRDIKGNKKPLE